MNPQPPSPPPPDPSSLSLQDPPSPPQAVPEDDSLGLPGQSDHDAHYDMILCAATAARAHPQLMLPDKPLAPERKKVLDQGPFQSYFTAELRTALRLNNAWVQPFHDEVVRAARACAQLAKEWRRPLKPIEEKAVRMYFTQARVLIDYVRTKVEYDNTIVRYLDPPGDDFIVVARCTDWIPRERNMDFVPTALQAFLLSWHLGHGNTRRFRHANPTVPFDVYFRVVSGSAVGGLDAEGRHPKWGRYIDLLRGARRILVIGPSGFADDKVTLLYGLCQGTADLLFLLPGQQGGMQLIACTRDEFVDLLAKRQGGFPGWETLLHWMEAGEMERRLYALGRGLHGGNELHRYDYVRQGGVMELAAGLPTADAAAVPPYDVKEDSEGYFRDTARIESKWRVTVGGGDAGM